MNFKLNIKTNFKKGQSYNGSKIEKAINFITDDDFNFTDNYELILQIKKDCKRD